MAVSALAVLPAALRSLADLPTALRGALGFLSRLPVGHDDAAWAAFTATPASLPLSGYVLGGMLVLVVAVPAPAPVVALALVVAVYLLTGVTHADGVTDVGDAAAVHGDAERRREVLKDSAVGTGGALALAVVVAGLALAGVGLAALPPLAAAVVLAAEVGAKLGMAALVALGTAPHDGLGSSLTGESGPCSFVPAVAVAAPAAASGWALAVATGDAGATVALRAGAATTASVVAAVVVALLVGRWARRYLGGVSGDVLGAANELGRVAALHAGVVAWTRF